LNIFPQNLISLHHKILITNFLLDDEKPGKMERKFKTDKFYDPTLCFIAKRCFILRFFLSKNKRMEKVQKENIFLRQKKNYEKSF
jgi:hypothetical protein